MSPRTRGHPPIAVNQVLPTADFNRALRGHREAFEDLYRTNYAFVRRCARRFGVAEDDVDDVIQDVFVIAYRRLDQLEPTIKPSTWLFGILRNVVRNRDRGRRRRTRRVRAFADHVQGRERVRHRREAELGERVLAREAVEAFLLDLDQRQREVFILAELEGYTGREIAESLAINPNTVHSRLRLARRAFCRHFEIEPRRRAVAEALGPAREHVEQAPPQAQARSLGLILAAVASPWREGEASLGAKLLAWCGTKAGVSVVGLSLASAALVGVSVRAAAGGGAGEGVEVVGAASSSEGPQGRSRATASPTMLADADPPLEPIAVEAPPAREPADSLVPRARREVRAELGPAEQLRLAREALVSGQPREALAALELVTADEGALLEQRIATEVAARCKLGDAAGARRALEPLRARESAAALIARIDHACW